MPDKKTTITSIATLLLSATLIVGVLVATPTPEKQAHKAKAIPTAKGQDLTHAGSQLKAVAPSFSTPVPSLNLNSNKTNANKPNANKATTKTNGKTNPYKPEKTINYQATDQVPSLTWTPDAPVKSVSLSPKSGETTVAGKVTDFQATIPRLSPTNQGQSLSKAAVDTIKKQVDENPDYIEVLNNKPEDVIFTPLTIGEDTYTITNNNVLYVTHKDKSQDFYQLVTPTDWVLFQNGTKLKPDDYMKVVKYFNTTNAYIAKYNIKMAGS